MHRRIALVLALAVALGVAAFAAVTRDASGSPARKHVVVAPIKVTVTEKDFAFVLSKKTLPKGKPILFTITNKGPSPHDFDISGTKGTAIIQAGKKITQKVTFKKAGRFRYVCTVPRHAQFGMTGNLTIK